MWLKYRFEIKEEHERPKIFPPPGPFWYTGFSGDNVVIVVAYLPEDENIFDYWPEAKRVDEEERNKIEFTARFPKPQWWNG